MNTDVKIEDNPALDAIREGLNTLDSKVPNGPLKDKWTSYKDKINLVNPAN
jgi:hypothetical protein